MWIRNNIKQTDLKLTSGITIGAFDGVHLGHKALIRRMVTESHAQGLVPVVITFDPLPGQVLYPESYFLLSTLEERLNRIAALGVQGTVLLPFNPTLMQTSASAFVDQVVRNLGMRGLWVGPDFTVGRGKEGDVTFLKASGKEKGYNVHVFEEIVHWGDSPVRSSRIRDALHAGDIQEANGCLGYPYPLSGIIAHGDQRGRLLGFPTANLSVSAQRLLPANGVYICQAHLPRGSFNAITNVGTRPTFDNGKRTVEAYLLDFSGDIYGSTMQLDFLKRLRPELQFTSVKELITQMTEDEATARRWLQTEREDVLTAHRKAEPMVQD